MKFVGVENILVIKLRNIGDVLLTVPAIRAVRERFPDAHICALVNRGTEEMLTGSPFIDEVMVFDRSIKALPFFSRAKKEITLLQEIRGRGFDMTIDLTSGDRAAIYSLLSGARYRIGYDPEGKGFLGKRYVYTHMGKRLDGSVHTVIQNLHLLRQFVINTHDLKVDIHFSEEDIEYAESLLSENGLKDETYVHIHPTSRWLFKCWKDEHMAEVITWLLQRDLGVVVTSSTEKGEMEKAKRILSLVDSRFTVNDSRLLDLCGRTTLKHMAVISSGASLFFGVDSAPMHIAAAVGTPVIALFGPTGAYDWGPWDNRDSSRFKVQNSRSWTPYTEKNGVQRSRLHTVIQRDWDCIPCGKDGCDGTKVSRCLEEIGADEVIGVIEERLKEIANGRIPERIEKVANGTGIK